MNELFKIVKIAPQSENLLVIEYSDGEKYLVDFKRIIAIGGVFKSLEDPRFFLRARIVRRGRAVEWPGGIDFCADALRISGKPIQQQKTQARPRQVMASQNKDN